jgi:chemotaxis protein MotB
MRRFVIISMVFVFCGSLIVLAGCSSSPYTAERWKQLAQMRDDLVKQKEALQAQIEDLKKQLAGLDKMKAEYDRVASDLKNAQAMLDALNSQLGEKDTTIADLKQRLIEEGLNAKVFGNGVAVPLQGDVLFDSGKSELKDDGRKILQNAGDRISDVITKGHFEIEWIRIDGHTDSDKITHSGFRDNWDLGAARAATVRQFLHELGGWEQYKTYVASYADTVPVDTNDTKVGKAKNRRVEIYIVPKLKGVSATPATSTRGGTLAPEAPADSPELPAPHGTTHAK